MADFREGDRVRYIGPPDEEVKEGELGWLLEVEPELGESVVEWDDSGTEVVGDLGLLEKVADRNEPDPHKRIAGDPFG